MQMRNRPLNPGIYVYAFGAIFLGLLGLVSGDFATGWQHVGPQVPFRVPLAYLTSIIELAAGLALLWRRAARAGAFALTVLYFVFTVVWIPKYLEDLHNFDPLGNVFEEFSLVVAGAVLVASFSPAGSLLWRREPLFARLYGLSAISFGVGHIYYMPGLLSGIPKWLPPSQMFWFYVTTIGFFLAAAAILSGVMAPLASRLITAEILGFEMLYWIPKLFLHPHDHFIWAGNAISIALSGAAWVVADSICRGANRAPSHRESVQTIRPRGGSRPGTTTPGE
jgi:uncharacterized membrane protein YphA (DoxX/SURF4 family)